MSIRNKNLKHTKRRVHNIYILLYTHIKILGILSFHLPPDTQALENKQKNKKIQYQLS